MANKLDDEILISIDTQVSDTGYYQRLKKQISHEDPDAAYEELIEKIDMAIKTTRYEARESRKHMDLELARTQGELIMKIREGNLTIIDSIKNNATDNIRTLSLLILGASSFSLIISFMFKIHILNPFFAIIILIASFGFFLMTKFQ